MNCPKCGKRSAVIDSRPRKTGVFRRRECNHCGHRYSTVERLYEGRDASLDRVAKRMQHVEGELVDLGDVVRKLVGDRE